MARKSTADVAEELTPAKKLATYDRELRALRMRKRETTREINDRIKAVEGFMDKLSGEVLGEAGAPTGNFFERGDARED